MRRLTVPATLESLAVISEFVKRAAAEADLDKRTAYRLRLSVIELATNTITHGFSGTDGANIIALEAETDEHCVTLTLEDAGIPFDPSQTPAPDDLDWSAEDRRIGGMGVYLALRSVDAFRYQRVADQNRSMLVINRVSPKTAVGE